MSLNDVLTDARAGKIPNKSDDELRSMLIVCSGHLGQSSDTWTANQIPFAITAIRDELTSRQLAKKHQEAIAEQQRLQQKTTEHGGKLHGETMDEMVKLKDSVDLVKTSVDQLARARWIDWAILIAGSIAAIAAVILLFR